MHYPSTLSKHASAIVLNILDNEGCMHGYRLTQRYKVVVQSQVKEGMLYPILHLLEREGYLTAETSLADNRRRKHYSLSPKGKKHQKKLAST